ncbi:MAG: tRNA-processing RNAse [Candidatus Solibacter sp.]|nr:tRNA-processing RNAse [Candidatus Solibacter sp.]
MAGSDPPIIDAQIVISPTDSTSDSTSDSPSVSPLDPPSVGAPIVLEAGGSEYMTPAGGACRYRKPLLSLRWADLKVLSSESVEQWSVHKGARLGAALAFYTLLSLAPLVLVVVTIGGLVFGRQAAQSQVVWQVREVVGPAGAAAIQTLLTGAQNKEHGVLATVLGLVTLLFGASAVLVELRDALNTIWGIPVRASTGFQSVLAMVKERLFSFALVLATGFLLVVSLAVNAWISALGRFAMLLPLSEGMLQTANAVVSFIVITGLFAAIYRIMPDTRIEWRDVVLGAAVTSLLFTIGRMLLGLYLGKAAFASTYGATASFVLLIVWVYYSGQIFFFGAEFTRAFATRYGSRPEPAVERHGRLITTAQN